MFRFSNREEKGLYDLFEFGILIKAIDGTLELVGGIALLFVSPEAIVKAILFFAQFELAEDPQDALLSHILNAAQNISSHALLFYAALFIGHGAIKLFLIGGIVKDKLWAYPAAIWTFAAFVAYQLYQINTNHSLLLTVITVVDVLVIALIAHEYRHAKKRLGERH